MAVGTNRVIGQGTEGESAVQHASGDTLLDVMIPGIKDSFLSVNYPIYVNEFLDKLPVKPTRDYVDKVIFLVIILAIYFAAAGQWLITLAVLLAGFIYYTFVQLKPRSVLFMVEKQGVRVHKDLFLWESLQDFWVAEKEGFFILYIHTRVAFPPLLSVVITDRRKARELVLTLGMFLPYRVIESQSVLDRYTYGKYIPPTRFVKASELLDHQEKLKEEIKLIVKRSQNRLPSLIKKYKLEKALETGSL